MHVSQSVWSILVGGALTMLVSLSAGGQVYGASASPRWMDMPDRDWVGRGYWANRLQDWRVSDGRLMCVADDALPMRTVHALTRQLTDRSAAFQLTVIGGLTDGSPNHPNAAMGMLIGVGQGKMDYRSAAIVHQWSGIGAGLFVGVNGQGSVVIADNAKERKSLSQSSGKLNSLRRVRLQVTGRPISTGYRLRVEAEAAQGTGKVAAKITLSPKRFVGNLALVSHPGAQRDRRPTNFWFRNWQIQGEKVRHTPGRSFGPIAATQYTLSEQRLNLTAQFLPVSDDAPRKAKLQVKRNGHWSTIGKAPINRLGYTATFHDIAWAAHKNVPYRVVWKGATYHGTIRHDPQGRRELVLASMNCNHNNSHGIAGGWGSAGVQVRGDWIKGMWFPHRDLVQNVAAHDPDMLFFAGDQVYEGKSPTKPDHDHLYKDYLYKWYLWCWAYRPLTRDRPTVTMPDDHDVYQGNIWGAGGRATQQQRRGGYVHPPEFVNMVQRTQTSHLPKPYAPKPVQQGIDVYYTKLVYGRVGFAILEDRKFKSGPSAHDLPSINRSQLERGPDLAGQLKKVDRQGLKLLGKRQQRFLEAFVGDWAGQDMKMALSQTPFGQLTTHSGPRLTPTIADWDSNGWPQTARNEAVALMRKGLLFHLAGDQHLGMLARLGIERAGDAFWTFCVPPTANFFPRAWAPSLGPSYQYPKPGAVQGKFVDGWGHPVYVEAAANPGRAFGRTPVDLYERVPGYGIVRMDPKQQTYTAECWPRWAGPGETQYPGWPHTIDLGSNDGRAPKAYLPKLEVIGTDKPVFHVYKSDGDRLIYARRVKARVFQPPVYESGTYRVRISDPDKQLSGWLTKLKATNQAEAGRRVFKLKPSAQRSQ
jgi:hypothetical protein